MERTFQDSALRKWEAAWAVRGMLAGVIFDKDGTLFDFQQTWGAWGETALSTLAGGDDLLCQRLADIVGFDRILSRFHPGSPAIAGTNAEVAILLKAEMPHRTEEEVLFELNKLSRDATMAEAVPLGPFLTELRAYGLRLGVATNDSEDAARAHLSATGAFEYFHQVLGYDSGYGAKPDPGMLLAFCDLEGLDPSNVAMVGDSTHDLQAGREAGMITIGVLTGVARAEDLTALADEILPDIGHLSSSETLSPLRAHAQQARA